MINPRWKKVLADLWSNKTRTLLVSLSIAVGVFAVGMIFESRIRMLNGLSEQYLRGDPFSAVLVTDQPFDDTLLDVIRKMDGVGDADARKSVTVRLKAGPNEWKNLSLDAIPDFNDIRVSKMRPISGAWPPPSKELVIERSALSPMLGLRLHLGEVVTIETVDQKERQIRIAGVVHDLNNPPTFLFNTYFGYITEDTLEWLGEKPYEYNVLYFRVDKERFLDPAYVLKVTQRVRNKVESSGREVKDIFIPPEPGKSPTASFGLEPLVLILSVVGVLALFLSGFLVTNTIAGLLSQQTKQIGIMKAIGATSQQVLQMYLVLVVCFGLIALVVGAPLAYLAADAFTNMFAAMFNFDPPNYGILFQVVVLELFVSLVVPIMGSLYPLIHGVRVTIREAISTSSGAGQYGTSIIDRMMNHVQSLPRPVLLSLRNTVRRKGRLALTLTTLTTAGATFIAVFSVQDSVKVSLDEIFASLNRTDIQVNFDRNYRRKFVIQEALRIPGVTYAETWGSIVTRRLRPDGSDSDTIFLQGIPFGSSLINPNILEGRWLQAEDTNAVVISSGLVKKEPDLKVGGAITIKINDRETNWRIVGIFKGFGDNLIVFSNLHHYDREVRQAGSANNVHIVTAQHDGPYQEEVAKVVEQHFRKVGLRVSSTNTSVSEYNRAIDQFNIIIYCLLIMAMLTAIVGGLGLAGTMSMNVLERTREIGVMRAIGASDFSVLQVVLVEGLMIGLISWSLGLLVAFPISKLLSDGVGTLFTGSPFTYTYSIRGAILWLVISLVLAMLASFLPAWNASRLTVRDVLAYE